MKTLAWLFMFIMITCVDAGEVVVRAPEGELYVLEVDRNEGFLEVMEGLHSCFGLQEDCLVDLMAANSALQPTVTIRNSSRQYATAVTPSERENIAFIVNTLGTASLIKIAKNKSALKSAGERIEHLHPLRFLMTVFTDEQMKTSLHAMQSRGWIWKEFDEGLKRGLREEAAKGNMKVEYLHDFAHQVGIDPHFLLEPMNRGDWTLFITTLIHHIPRDSDAGRYDM